MKKIVIVIGAFVIICIGTVLLFTLLRNNEISTQNNSNGPVNAVSTDKILYVSNYDVYVALVKNVRAGTYTMRLIDIKTGSVRKTFSTVQPSLMHNFIWDEKSSRIYFSATTVADNFTTFFYIDLNDPDPNAITEIVYDQNGILSGKLDIIGTDNDNIYFLVDDQIYSLNVADGLSAAPRLVD